MKKGFYVLVREIGPANPDYETYLAPPRLKLRRLAYVPRARKMDGLGVSVWLRVSRPLRDTRNSFRKK